jgi:hypothetical protein
MKKYILAAALGSAVILAVPAFATTTNYVFNFTACGTGNGAGACNDNISAYASTSNGVTATAVGMYYSVGNGGSFNNGASTGVLNVGDLGAYSGAGLGACESTAANCNPPLHQIDNGTNGISANDDFEFLLIKFSAAVDLSSIQLGNYGNGNADPFKITYYTSTAALNSLGSLAGTTLGSGNSFSSNQSQSSQSTTGGSSCVSGSTLCVDNLSGAATNGVTYLLIGASIGDNGTDYFKIQDISASSTSNNQSATPEPATFGMIGLALAGLGVYGRKRKNRS